MNPECVAPEAPGETTEPPNQMQANENKQEGISLSNKATSLPTNCKSQPQMALHPQAPQQEGVPMQPMVFLVAWPSMPQAMQSCMQSGGNSGQNAGAITPENSSQVQSGSNGAQDFRNQPYPVMVGTTMGPMVAQMSLGASQSVAVMQNQSPDNDKSSEVPPLSALPVSLMPQPSNSQQIPQMLPQGYGHFVQPSYPQASLVPLPLINNSVRPNFETKPTQPLHHDLDIKRKDLTEAESKRQQYIARKLKPPSHETKRKFVDSMAIQIARYHDMLRERDLRPIKLRDSTFKCSLCPEVMPRSSLFHRHAPTHLPEKPFQCCFCMNRFSRQDSLKRHYDRCALTGDSPRHMAFTK